MTNTWLNFSRMPRPSRRYQTRVIVREPKRSLSANCFLSSAVNVLRPINTSSSSVGATAAVKAIHCPSGDHAASLTPLSILVSLRASPPPVSISQSWFLSSSRLERNNKRLLSGAHVGFVSFLLPLVSWRAAPTACPCSSRWSSQIALCRSSLALSVVCTTKATRLPSGERATEPMVLKDHRSSRVSLRGMECSSCSSLFLTSSLRDTFQHSRCAPFIVSPKVGILLEKGNVPSLMEKFSKQPGSRIGPSD